MKAPYELLLALRYLRVQRGRTFLSVITMISVAGVAVGTAALVIALAPRTLRVWALGSEVGATAAARAIAAGIEAGVL